MSEGAFSIFQGARGIPGHSRGIPARSRRVCNPPLLLPGYNQLAPAKSKVSPFVSV